MTVPDPSPAELGARLARLEEASLYAERTGEQLGESITDLSRRLDAALQRLARLEGRLGKVEETQVQAEPPQDPEPQGPEP